MGQHIRIENERQTNRPEQDRFDLIGVWLLLLFVVIFFGIAAEEARKPSLFATTSAAAFSNPVQPLRNLMGTETSPTKKAPTKERTK